MKKTITFSTLILAVLALSSLTGCSNKPSTTIDFNPKTNFASFTDFQFSPQQKTTLDANPVMTNRIQSAVEQSLSNKGLTKVNYIDNQSADITIKVYFNQQEKQNNSSFNIGFGTGRVSSHGGGSIGVSTSGPINSDAIIVTKITIDMSHDGKAVWHGVDNYEARNDLTAEEVNNAVSLTVNSILANFPPEKVTDNK